MISLVFSVQGNRLRFLAVLLPALFMMSAGHASAQTMAEEFPAYANGWKQAFSEEGKQNWKPEFTVRGFAAPYSTQWMLTGGVRIDERRTLGLMAGQGFIDDDATPGEAQYAMAGLYLRRYFHTGEKRIVSFYADLSAGVGYLYKDSTGRDKSDPKVLPILSLQPGIRFRFWRNTHLFLGPSFSTAGIGLHIGAGF